MLQGFEPSPNPLIRPETPLEASSKEKVKVMAEAAWGPSIDAAATPRAAALLRKEFDASLSVHRLHSSLTPCKLQAGVAVGTVLQAVARGRLGLPPPLRLPARKGRSVDLIVCVGVRHIFPGSPCP